MEQIGIIEEWSIKPTKDGKERLVFKLGGVTYGAFDEAAAKGKEIFTNNPKQAIKFDYEDNVSGSMTFHNIKSIETTTDVSPTANATPIPVEQIAGTEVSLPAFGLACKQAGFCLGEKLKDLVDEDWNAYDKLVLIFYKHNKQILEKLK